VARTIMAVPEEERDHVLNNLPYQLQVDVVQVMGEMEGGSWHSQQGPGASGGSPAPVADIQTSSFDIDALVQAEAQGQGSPPFATTVSQIRHAPLSPPTQRPPPAAEHSADLLGIGEDGGGGEGLASSRPAAQQQQQKQQHFQQQHHHQQQQQHLQAQQQQKQLLQQQQQQQQQQVPRVASVEEVDDFFSGGAAASAPGRAAPSAAPAPPAPPAMSPATAKLYTAPPKPGRQQASAVADEGKEPAVDWAKLEEEDKARAHTQATQQQQMHQAEEDEPELRRQLRAARLAERQSKMDAALAEKHAKDEEEARKQAEQVELKDKLKARIETWRSNKKGNIRAMLGSLEHVLWEGSGWKPVGMGDLLEPPQVKKVYMKANLLVHPDKVRQRNGTPEQVAIADMIFDVLKEAWIVFQR